MLEKARKILDLIKEVGKGSRPEQAVEQITLYCEIPKCPQPIIYYGTRKELKKIARNHQSSDQILNKVHEHYTATGHDLFVSSNEEVLQVKVISGISRLPMYEMKLVP